jgi:hypothetical protein
MSKLKKLWPYDINDKTTWKYSGFKTIEMNGRKFFHRWQLNPKFAYKHLDPIYPDIIRKRHADK